MASTRGGSLCLAKRAAATSFGVRQIRRAPRREADGCRGMGGYAALARHSLRNVPAAESATSWRLGVLSDRRASIRAADGRGRTQALFVRVARWRPSRGERGSPPQPESCLL